MALKDTQDHPIEIPGSLVPIPIPLPQGELLVEIEEGDGEDERNWAIAEDMAWEEELC